MNEIAYCSCHLPAPSSLAIRVIMLYTERRHQLAPTATVHGNRPESMLSRKANILRTVSGDTTAATIVATLATVTKASTAYVTQAHGAAAVSPNLLLVDECGPLLVTEECGGEGRPAVASAAATLAILSLLRSLVLSELRSAPAGLRRGHTICFTVPRVERMFGRVGIP